MGKVRVSGAGAVREVTLARPDKRNALDSEMLAELKAAGASNYSIFLDGDRLFGYLEVEDLRRFQRYMAASDVNARWQADMGVLIDPLTDPATGFHPQLDEVFHLG